VIQKNWKSQGTNSGLGQTFPAACGDVDGVSECTGRSPSSVLGPQHSRQATQTACYCTALRLSGWRWSGAVNFAAVSRRYKRIMNYGNYV